MAKIPRRSDGGSPLSLAGAGVELGGTVCLLALVGWWLDNKWGSSPWLLLTGTFIGIVGGIYNLWRVGKRFFRK